MGRLTVKEITGNETFLFTYLKWQSGHDRNLGDYLNSPKHPKMVHSFSCDFIRLQKTLLRQLGENAEYSNTNEISQWNDMAWFSSTSPHYKWSVILSDYCLKTLMLQQSLVLNIQLRWNPNGFLLKNLREPALYNYKTCWLLRQEWQTLKRLQELWESRLVMKEES